MLFVDNILIFGSGSSAKWEHYKELFDLLCVASSMSINFLKSHFLSYGADKFTHDQILEVFPCNWSELSEGFKYLGFFIKPKCYAIKDWNWLLKKFDFGTRSWDAWFWKMVFSKAFMYSGFPYILSPPRFLFS